MIVSSGRRVDGAGDYPVIGDRIVSPARVQQVTLNPIEVIAAPYDHFTAGPNCRVIYSANWRIDGAGRRPTVSSRIVTSSRIQKIGVLVVRKNSAPNNHFTPGPH